MIKLLFINAIFLLFAAQAALSAPAQIFDSNGNRIVNGSQTSVNSVPVVIASDQGSIAVTGTFASNGVIPSDHARIDYSGTNVTTAAYVQLLASTSNTIGAIEIFDSSGQTLLLAVGAAASEVDQIYVIPGGNGRIPITIANGARVSLKAVTGTASTGYIDATFYK